MNDTIRNILAASDAARLGCTAEEAELIHDLFPGRVPERISLDREAGRGWLYFEGERCPATLGTSPLSARLLASLLGR